MIQPPRLRNGQTVSIVAPAGPPDPDMLDRGVRFLTRAGFRVNLGRHVLSRQAYLAGPDSARLHDLNAALRDPDVRAVFCARGGYGSARIVNSVDYAAMTADPKIFVGYSDITTLHAAFAKHSGVVTFHGPLIGSQRASEWSYQQLLSTITGTRNHTTWPAAPDLPEPRVLRPGVCSGPLFGGCLSILTTLAGTHHLPDLSGKILFIEEVGEAPYRIDRMLHHLKNAGWFEHIAGLMFAQFVNCRQRDDDPEPTFTVDEICRSITSNLAIPAVQGIPIGHSPHNLTVPMGLTVDLHADVPCVTVEQPAAVT